MYKWFLLIIIFISMIGFSEEIKDPFSTVLPKEEPSFEAEEQKVTPPSVIVEGVLWETDKPSAIIDGEVYYEGDRLKNIEAFISKIERNTVFIMYKGRTWKMSVEKRGGKE